MIWFDVDTALSEVPVNVSALIDDTDFKTREESVTYDQAGMDLVWNFVTTAGAYTQTAVTPTTAGVHDWTNQGNGMYSLEIPDTGGTINNDTEGFGWFTGFATGILPWTGPICGFRAAAVNNDLIDAGAALAKAAALTTAQNDLDTLTGADGVTLATAQGNYAPATAASLATVDGIVDDLKLGIILGSAATGTLSTTQCTSDLTGYADDQLIGRVIIFTSGDADGEATDITDYASTNGLLTFTALTTAPANGDTFKIV